ncbi:MAG: tetratricopeptide repeat protein [Bacteroidia bacterium]
MKKSLIFISLSLLVMKGAAQENNLNNANNYLRSGELDKAKNAIDLAAEHEKTKTQNKMWYYRGKTYLAICESKDFKNLDSDAPVKAFVSFINLLKADKNNVYTKEVTGFMISSAIRTYNHGLDEYRNGNFIKAAEELSLIFEAFPFDKDKGLTRSNISPEALNYDLYSISLDAKDIGKAKEYLQKLIDAKYKSSKIYIDMSRIYLSEKDTAKALQYIEMGRGIFDDDVKLINAELAIYIQQHKTDVLLEKINKAIESTPDNELLYYTQGLIYNEKKQPEKAEEAYKKVVELKPDHFDANFELAVMYFNRAVEWNNKASNLPLSETKKQQEYDQKAKADFASAAASFEKCHELNSNDLTTVQSLMKVYRILGDESKSLAMKEKADKIKAAKKK